MTVGDRVRGINYGCTGVVTKITTNYVYVRWDYQERSFMIRPENVVKI